MVKQGHVGLILQDACKLRLICDVNASLPRIFHVHQAVLVMCFCQSSTRQARAVEAWAMTSGRVSEPTGKHCRAARVLQSVFQVRRVVAGHGLCPWADGALRLSVRHRDRERQPFWLKPPDTLGEPP